MATKKIVNRKKTVKTNGTAFIALVLDTKRKRNSRGNYVRERGDYVYEKTWTVCGTDLHTSVEKARACGCAENSPEDVAVLEVKVVSMHRAKLVFTKEETIGIKYND